MKNVFFSILVIFLLAFSMLGSINLVKAESNNIVLSNIESITAVKGVDNSVQISFNIRNIDNANDLVVDITSSDPETSDHIHTLDIANNLIKDNMDLVHNAAALPITFSVPIPANVVVGAYTGKITVQDTVDATNFKELSYSINVQDLVQRIAVTSGLNENSELVMTSQQDNTLTKQFTLQNTGNVALNDLKFKITDGTFTDGTETIQLKVKFGNQNAFTNVVLNTPINMDPLTVGSSIIVYVEAVIPQDIQLDTYSGNIVIADTTYTQATSTTPLLIKIEPEICSDGRRSNGLIVDGPKSGDLRIKIDSPDKGDDFKIADEISIDGDIENKGNKDLDVVVEAMLYDLDDNNKITSIESDSIAVNNDETERYDLTMIVPNDQDIDPRHTYILYVKGYDDGNEDQYCNYDSVEINMKRENDDVIMDANSFIINPTVAQQGSVVSFSVRVENIGTDEQKGSYIIIKNDELKLNLKSNLFNLKRYDKSGNEYIWNVDNLFTVPVDATPKDYTIIATVYYNNGRDTRSLPGTLTVQEKAQAVTTPETTTHTTPTTTPTGAGTYTPTKSILSDLGSTKTLFIIGDIVLVILAVLFLVLIFKKR